jgi:uncharacterized RDD family membrane protein YckC
VRQDDGMSTAAGWYRDPADPDTQRYWDGEQWLGERLPVEAAPPAGPLTPAPAAAPVPPAGPPPAYGSPPAYVTPPEYVTPAVPAGVGTIAPVMERLAARMIDSIAVLGLNIVVNGYFVFEYVRELAPVIRAMQNGAAFTADSLTDRAKTLQVIIAVVATALWFAYEVPAVATTGQTLGKRLLGIRVVRVDGDPLGFGRSIQRWSVPGLPTLVGAWLFPLQILDAAWCLLDKPRRQCLHDKLAGTVVVAAPTTPKP